MKDDLTDTMSSCGPLAPKDNNIFPEVNTNLHASAYKGRHELVKLNAIKMDESRLHLKVERSNRLIILDRKKTDDDF